MNDGRSYSTSEIARRLGVSTGYVRSQIKAGLLMPHGCGHRHALSRTSIYRWLIATEWEASEIRRLFPLPGPLAVVTLRKDFLLPAVEIEGPRWFDRLFDMALSMAEISPWGILIDFYSIGANRSYEQMFEFSKVADRPTIIGLTGDEGASPPGDGGDVFDILIPGSLPVGKIAQRIRAVRPWGK